MQDRITESVVGAVEPSLRRAEIERARATPTVNLHAYDYFLRAWQKLSIDPRPQAIDDALDELRRAIELDPDYSAAKALFGWATQLRASTRGRRIETEVREGVRLAREAIAAHRDDPITLVTAGWALCWLDSAYDEAMDAVDRALKLAPDVAVVLNHAGWVRAFAGDPAEAEALLRRAIRVSPLDPQMAHLLHGLSIAYLRQENYAEALAASERASRERPTAQRTLLLSLVGLGRLPEAKALAKRMRDSSVTTTISWFEAVPFRDEAFKARCVAALRAAGIPE